MLLSLFSCLALAAGPPPFRIGIELPSQVPMTAAERAALAELGIGYINYYVNSTPNAPDLPVAQVNAEMMGVAESLGAEFSISCHQLGPPEECVRAAVAHGRDAKHKARFRGVVFDELEHARLLNNMSPVPLADPAAFASLPQAAEATLAGYRKLHDRYANLGSPVVATHIWPVLFHTAARAGFTPCAKICKETYSPVSLAIAMGAAKQYGTELWADCDLWFWDLIPGHEPEEFRSNLLLAYWLGVDLMYVEGAGYNLKPAGRQGTPFALVNVISEDTYQLTPHGEVLRWFCRQYVPAHPRGYTFRDLRPAVAVVRFDDTCHGQRYTGDWPDRLFGSDRLHSNADTEGWLGMWNLLTFGRTGRDGLSLFKAWVGPSGYERPVKQDMAASYLTRPVQADMHRFWAPLTGAAVYDHIVRYELLRGVPLIFLAGTQVSAETMADIGRCVEEGAVCVAWGPLARGNGFADWQNGVKVVSRGKGRFVLTDDFGYREVYQEIKLLIGRPDEIRYRFGDREVVLRRVTDNQIAVEAHPIGR